MEVIYILGASQAFFLSFLIFKKANKSDGDYVLAAWLAFMGLHLLNQYVFSIELGFEYPHLLGLGICFPILQGPFMFVYILVMIGKDGKFKSVYLLHGLPFLVCTIYFVFDFYFLEAAEKLAYYKILAAEGSLMLGIVETLNILLGPIYVVWSLIKLRWHTKNISDRFSYTEEIDLKWLNYVLIGLGLLWLVVLVSDIVDLFSTYEDLGNKLIYSSLTIAIFFLGYFGIKQKAIYLSPSDSPGATINQVEGSSAREPNRYKNSGLKEEDSKKYLEQLLKYMDDDKPYLNGKLSLKDVADQMDISVNHLSQVINEQSGKSFFDFVNSYRVEEVKRLLNESKHEQFTLLSLAYDSGFNSKSSFNSIFKKITGVTPSQYIHS